MLETEARIKKAKLNRLREVIDTRCEEAGIKDFSDDERKSVAEFLKWKPSEGGLRESEMTRWTRIYREKEEVEDWKVHVFYDFPRPLKIYLSFPDSGQKVIDILASLKKDIANIGNPFIIKAIERYRRLTDFHSPPKEKISLRENHNRPLNSDQAFACLEEICKVLKCPKNSPRALTKFMGVFDSKWSSLPYGLEEFSEICVLLKYKAVRTSRTISNKLMFVRRGLAESFPDTDFQDALAWLELRMREGTLPKRLDESTLRNDFYSWKWRVSVGTAKIYMTKLRKQGDLGSKINFTDDEIAKISDEWLFNIVGSCEIPFYDDISKLVTSEASLEDLEVPELALED